MSARKEIIVGLFAGAMIGLLISRSKKESEKTLVKPFEPGGPEMAELCRGCQHYDSRQDPLERGLLISAGIPVPEKPNVSPCAEARASSYKARSLMEQPGLWRIEGKLIQACNSRVPYRR